MEMDSPTRPRLAGYPTGTTLALAAHPAYFAGAGDMCVFDVHRAAGTLRVCCGYF